MKAWIFALIDLAMVLLSLFTDPFPYNLFSVIALANYFLFFGKDVLNVIPMSWRCLLYTSQTSITSEALFHAPAAATPAGNVTVRRKPYG